MSWIDSIKNNGFLRGIYYYPQKNQLKKASEALEDEAKRRESGYFDPRYEKLKGMKGKFNGERCFIVATGPSLTISDLELIANEYSFGMNSICKLFGSTTWRPTFYGIQDKNVYEKMKDIIGQNFSQDDIVFTASTLNNPNYIEFPFNDVYNRYDAERRIFHAKFTDNAYGTVYNGFTITYSLIQIAIYLGFRKIYLLGVDCSYKKGEKNHVVESGHVDKYDYLLNYKRMITSYGVAKYYADSHNITIVNCTRGGMLEVFPREKLEEVLEEKR